MYIVLPVYSKPQSSWLEMVLCVVIGCSKRSRRDKDVSFLEFPKTVTVSQSMKKYDENKKTLGWVSCGDIRGLEESRFGK